MGVRATIGPLSEDFAGNHFRTHAGLMVAVDWYICRFKFLVLGLTELIRCIKIDPQLEAMCWLVKASGHLRMHDPPTSRHPLDVSGSNLTLMTFKVLMQYFARKNVRDSLESTVGDHRGIPQVV